MSNGYHAEKTGESNAQRIGDLEKDQRLLEKDYVEFKTEVKTSYYWIKKGIWALIILMGGEHAYNISKVIFGG